MDLTPTLPDVSEQDAASPPSPPSAPPVDEAPAACFTEEASPSLSEAPPGRDYPSLYDTKDTTMVAILLGIVIIVSIQIGVARIFKLYREEHRALTAFATSMVALVVGIYVCDMLIAGPTTELLSDGERLSILGFVNDTALMVFAYYFGTKAQVPTDLPRE
jgi:uncharacterized membrane protein